MRVPLTKLASVTLSLTSNLAARAPYLVSGVDAGAPLDEELDNARAVVDGGPVERRASPLPRAAAEQPPHAFRAIAETLGRGDKRSGRATMA